MWTTNRALVMSEGGFEPLLDYSIRLLTTHPQLLNYAYANISHLDSTHHRDSTVEAIISSSHIYTNSNASHQHPSPNAIYTKSHRFTQTPLSYLIVPGNVQHDAGAHGNSRKLN